MAHTLTMTELEPIQAPSDAKDFAAAGEHISESSSFHSPDTREADARFRSKPDTPHYPITVRSSLES